MDELERIKEIVKDIPDPWGSSRTRLLEDGTYDGDGKDIIACRDAIHNIKEILGL